MKMNLRNAVFVLTAGILLTVSLSVSADKDKPPKLFSVNDEMQVTITGPWYEIQRKKKKDSEYPVQLAYTGADGQQHTIDATVTLRGITRRRICDFPPLKLHFDKDSPYLLMISPTISLLKFQNMKLTLLLFVSR